MDLFETLHTCCGHIEAVHVGILMELKLILLLLHFQWIFLKLCILVVDLLKMCMWVFDGAKVNFDRITAFRT